MKKRTAEKESEAPTQEGSSSHRAPDPASDLFPVQMKFESSRTLEHHKIEFILRVLDRIF